MRSVFKHVFKALGLLKAEVDLPIPVHLRQAICLGQMNQNLKFFNAGKRKSRSFHIFSFFWDK